MKRILLISVVLILIFGGHYFLSHRYLPIISRYSDGSDKLIGTLRINYLDSIPIGLWTAYYPNGSIKYYINYGDNGLEHGQKSEFYYNGNRKFLINYINGKREGVYLSFYENGITKCKGKFELNKPAGDWIYFSLDGDTTEVISH